MNFKNTARLLAFSALLLLTLTACGEKSKLVGVWRCELYGSDLIVEFTRDGKFVDHIDSVENRYRVKGKKLEIYVEDAPESMLEIDFSVKGDTLTFGGAEYERVKQPALSESETNGRIEEENGENGEADS